MRTLFALLIERCGLSHREAGELLDVRIDTVKSWSAGRNRAPVGVIVQLRALYRRIESAAGEMAREIERLSARHGAPEAVDIGLACDDAEAQSLGWPCVGAHAAVLGIVAARINVPLAIAPRGTTSAAAAAIDAREARRRKTQ
jgi:hypothetical protein